MRDPERGSADVAESDVAPCTSFKIEMRRPTSGDGVPYQVHQSKNGLEAHSTEVGLCETQ